MNLEECSFQMLSTRCQGCQAPQLNFTGAFFVGVEILTGSAGSRKRVQRLKIHCVKKPAKKPASSRQEGEQAARVPPRIIDTSQLSLKQQKRLIEARRQFEQRAQQKQKQLQSKRWRKPKLDADERAVEEEKAREAARALKAEQERRRKVRKALVEMLRPSMVDKQPPVLLVDAYNVIMKRANLEAEHFWATQTLEEARERLINDTRDYALVVGCRAAVIFDAYNNLDMLATTREMVAGVEVVFTRGSDADMYIIAEVKLAKAGGAPRVVVVSDDREINDALDYGNSMGWMPSEMYLHEMERVARAADRRQQEAEEQQLDELLREGGVIAHGALRDRATLESLAALRQKLGNGRAGSGANKQLFRLERW